VFELMTRVLEGEQERLGGFPLRWERLFVGPRRDQAQVTLYQYGGEVTRLEANPLDLGRFELPAGLTLDDRRGAPRPAP
jgi:hypothetical protein